MSENKHETRKVYSYDYKEVSVEELRNRADAFESEPYGADQVIDESKSTTSCDHSETTRHDNTTTTISCKNKATHFYAQLEIPKYCRNHARELARKAAAEYRDRYCL